MKKQLIILLIILTIASLSTVCAGNNTTIIEMPTIHTEEGATIISEFEEYQNYFGYKIFFRNISDNSSAQINNSIINNSSNYLDKYQNNESILTEYDTIMIKDTIHSQTSTSNCKKIVKFPNQHVTGNNLKLLVAAMIIISGCIIIRKLY